MTYKNYFDKHTYVLTNSGWKYIKDVDIQVDSVAQFDNKYNVSFVSPYKYDEQFYKGPLVTVTSSSGLSLLTVTPDSELAYLQDDEGTVKHCKTLLKDVEIDKNNYLYTAGKRVSYELPEIYLDVKYTKDELALLQADAVVKGFSIIINDSEDNAYYLNTNTAPFESNDIIVSDYNDRIYTLSVPTGMLVTKRLNKVTVGCTNV